MPPVHDKHDGAHDMRAYDAQLAADWAARFRDGQLTVAARAIRRSNATKISGLT